MRMLFFLSGLILLCVCKFVKSGVNPDRFSVYSTLNKTVIRTHFLQTFVEKQELHSYNASLAFVCPELQMCGSQSHNIREPFDYNAFRGNCCPPCECSKTCFTTGTCCYDKYLPAQEKPLIGHRKREVQAIFVSLDSNLEKCHYVYIGGGGRTIDYVMRHASLKSYIMTKSCEPKEIDRNIIKKCIDPNFTHLEEITPVYSNVTNLNYFNKFCAACNFVTEGITKWKAHLRCSEETLNSDISILPNYEKNSTVVTLPNSCYMAWLPPNENYTRCIRYTNIISTCKSECSSPQLSFLCKTIHSPVFHLNKTLNNVFCLVCNYCVLKDLSCFEPNDIIGHGHLSENDYATFTMLVDHTFTFDDQLETPFEATAASLCGYGFIFVHKLGQCLPIQCGVFMVSRDGKCQPFGENIQGLDFDYRFTISHTATYGKQPFDYNMTEMALSLTSDETRSEMFCYLNVELDTFSENDTIVHKAVVIKRQTGILDIEKAMILFKQKIKLIKQDTELTKYSIAISIGYSSYKELPLIVSNFVQYAKSPDKKEPCLRIRAIAMSDLQFCNSLIIPINTFILLKNNSVILDKMMFSPSEYIIRTGDTDHGNMVQICLDTYQHKLTPVRSHASFVCSKLIYILFLLATVWVCDTCDAEIN